MPVMKIPAVIYARYSSLGQKEESIEQQVEECMKFAETNNLEVIEIYSDKAKSGRTDLRPQFLRMMRDAQKGEFRVVIAYKSSRMSRNMFQALQYEAKLEGYGIKTMYAKEEFGDNAAGRFALRTMMNVNQFYSENLAEDVRRGMYDNAENCKVNGPLPLGYQRSKEGLYEVNPTTEKVVQEIYEMFLAGTPYVRMAEILNGRGILTSRKRKWSKNSFHAILTNTNYIGVYHNSGVSVPGGVPRIISDEVFQAVQEKLKEGREVKGRKSDGDEFMLTGKLFCGHCNAPMVGISGTSRSGAKHYYYSCNTHRLHKCCDKKNVRRDWIEQRIAELTATHILVDDVIEWIAENAVSYQAQIRREGSVADQTARLAECRKGINNIMTAIEQGIITPTTKSRLMELEAEAADLERSIALAKQMEKPYEKERIIYALEKLRSGDVKDKRFQRLLIHTFVKAVYLWDDKIRIDYYYTGKRHSAEMPIDIAADADMSAVPECSYKRSYGVPEGAYTNTDVIIYLTLDSFVLLSPLLGK